MMNSKFAGFRGQLQVTFCRYDQFVVIAITYMWGRWDTPQNFFLAFMFLRYGACDGQNFFTFWPFFALLPSTFPPILQPEKSKFRKSEKNPGDIIILHKCTKNHDQMLYGSWDMVRDGCNYFSFWVIFCPFTPLKSEKNVWRYHHFTYAYQKLWSDDVRFLRYGVWQI